jgi:tetratricopeptide (TPR) repeat protein
LFPFRGEALGLAASSPRAAVKFSAMRFRATPLLIFAALATAGGQQRYTTQILVVPAFAGPDRGLAAKATDIVRSRVAGAFPKRELRVVSGGDVDDWLRLSGFEENVVLSEGELKEMAKKFRADERVTGSATRTEGRVRIAISLALTRDLRLAQPITGQGASVTEAAESVAREVIAARRQFVPLRQCENLLREGKAADATVAAAGAIAVYSRAVPARVCLLNALAKLESPPDTIVAVARAALGAAPANAAALQALAVALDRQQHNDLAADAWVKLLATDSTNEELTEMVVNALSREANSGMARPIIDRATVQHADNLVLLKLRWLVHLADRDWKGAVSAGEQLLAKDAATQSDAEFYVRLSNAYRADSQSVRALSTVAAGVARFPANAPLYVAYLQLLHSESEAALPRGLAAFPENAELHVVAAQTFKGSGNTAAALLETKRALGANPRLPHGFLQLAQLEFDAGEVDSAFVATESAPTHGEDPATAAQFALARGNALFKSATASQKRDDFQRAMKFLLLATRLGPTPEARFLLGASALSVSQSAATEAPASKSCDLSRLAESSLTEAEINLVSGGSAAPDAAKQYLDYVAKLRPYVADQLKSFC